MTALKCVVEGCNLEYDVICSFSFYNVNTMAEADGKRQEWIDGAMQEDSECLWRHVSLQLCGYHFELDAQGLWIDSPMLPELLTRREESDGKREDQTPQDKKGTAGSSGFQGLFESFVRVAPPKPRAAETIRLEHNYSAEPNSEPREEPACVSRLNVRHLVDTLGYLSLKNLQRKQLWVVRVETESAEASITQAEQVIAKLPPPKHIVEIIPQTSTSETVGETSAGPQNEVLQMIDDSSIPDNFIYEIAEEQEITMEEVNEITPTTKEWTVNIVPEETKPKYAYIKHCATGKKKRHFTQNMDILHTQGDYENLYILPDVDPSVGVEITTSYEPENYIVEEYQHLVLDERPKKRAGNTDPTKKKKKKITPMRSEVKQIQIKNEIGEEDWVIQNDIVYDQESDDYDDKKGRVRRKNKKYLGYDFVT